MTKGEMRGFIQAIYGGVLGVGSFNFLTRLKNDKHQIIDLFTKPNIFDLVFFLITLLIIAHDWFSFHSNDLKKGKGFGEYVPEMIGLLLMAQMFATANHSDMRYWYLFGFGYSFCNFINLKWGKYLEEKSEKFKEWKDYQIGSHFIITVVGFLIMKKYENVKIEDNPWPYIITLAITFFIVIGFWIKVDGIRNKDEEKKEADALQKMAEEKKQAKTLATELNSSISTVVEDYLKKERKGHTAVINKYHDTLVILINYEKKMAANVSQEEYLKENPTHKEVIETKTLIEFIKEPLSL